MLRDVLVVAHVVVAGIWMGSDVATFILSRTVLDRRQDPSARRTVAIAMVSVEVIARLCLPTMLGLGVALAIEGGWSTISAALVWPVLIGAALWVAMVWTIHRRSGESELASRLAMVDLGVRSAMAVVLWIVGFVSLFGDDGPFLGDWLAIKVIAFAIIITSGITIRFLLRPFGPALGALVAQGSTPEVEAALATTVGRAQPMVTVIWACLLTAVTLGVLKTVPW